MLRVLLLILFFLVLQGSSSPGQPWQGYHQTPTSSTFSVFADPASLTVQTDSSASFVVTVQANDGFNGTVNLYMYAFYDLPGENLACNFNPQSLTFNRSIMTAETRLTCIPFTAGTYHVGISICTSVCLYNSPTLISLTATGGPQPEPPQPDFNITVESPGSVTTGQSATATITITPWDEFHGRVVIAGEFPGKLLCGPITPPFVNSSGTASVSCSSLNVGIYTVAITGFAICTTPTYSGQCNRSAHFTLTVLSDLASPVYVYGALGAMIAGIETAARALIGRRRNRLKQNVG